MIVVFFDVDDTVVENGMTRVRCEGSITALRNISVASGPAELMFIGPPAVDDDDQNERISALSTVENVVWRRQIHEGDGFHPDDAGYEQLAAIIQKPLLECLTPQTAGTSPISPLVG